MYRLATATTLALLLAACANQEVKPAQTGLSGLLTGGGNANQGMKDGQVAAAAPAASAVKAAPASASAPAPARVASAPAPVRAASAPAASVPGAGAPAAAAPAGPPGGPPPFATVIREAKKIDGFFTAWQKDDKLWLELKPEDFGKPFFLSPKWTSGIGEGGFFGGTMGPYWFNFGGPQVVEFKRVHNQVQLLARNTEYIAQAGTPVARAVASSFSPSLLASTGVASAAHPERKTVLVEANGLFLNDMQGLSMLLQRQYRQGYSFDGRHSVITHVRGKPNLLVVETNNHFFTPSLAVPQPLPPGVPPQAAGPQPTAPKTLPDARSFFIGLHYSLSPLPAEPMAARRADPRIGFFTQNTNDYTSDLVRTPLLRHVTRWRLEKKDPSAELSEPVKPITYWLDRNVPLPYREPITRGVLEWNKAFERIGFKNAIVVKQQPDDADFDTLDTDVASIRWMTNAQPQFGAIGPSHADPRTGEILDADIAFEGVEARSLRTLRTQILAPQSQALWAQVMQARDALNEGMLPGAESHEHGPWCRHGELGAVQWAYASEVLTARGDLDPDGPEARQFVADYLTWTAMHEVGHTLGLRHNFRSSRAFTPEQLNSEAFTRANGLSGSVMEYPAINLALPGRPGGVPFQLALGPYDYWAIEYAYKPLPKETEAQELLRIAERSNQPGLEYATDEDNFIGIDPEALVFDLGSDPLAFARQRLEIARDLMQRQSSRTLSQERDYAVLRRSIGFALFDVGSSAGILARQIGGIRTLRDFPGSGRDPLVPVAAATQRAALDLLAKNYFAADAFPLPPALQRRLAPDFLQRGDSFGINGSGFVPTDFSIANVVLNMQRALLAQLMSDGVAVRILDSKGKFDKPGDAFRLSELYSRLSREIWSELGSPAALRDIAPPRRELQREHVNRVATQLLRPTGASRADARSLMRLEAQKLLQQMQAAAQRPGLLPESKAHLLDSVDTLRQAMDAKLPRVGV
jgi:hypothetical protein